MGVRVSFVIPTRNRPGDLRATLDALGRLPLDGIDADLVLVDNASDPPADAPARLDSGLPVSLVRLGENRLAAARNAGAEASDAEWLVMLDDDSAPVGAGLADALAGAPPDVGAIGAETFLPDGSRERGGLPEVVVGCAAAIRREAFLDAGGYDPAFGYYAEEYDLCAKLILGGWRVEHSRAWRVEHRKSAAGRDMNAILGRLVRNNVWVERRYAPAGAVDGAVAHTVERYRRIALKEGALRGYRVGLAEADTPQPRREMTGEQYARFTGLDHATRALGERVGAGPVALAAPGKNEGVVRAALDRLGVGVVPEPGEARAVVVATLSPGPAQDALERLAPGSPVPVASPVAWAGEAAPAARA